MLVLLIGKVTMSLVRSHILTARFGLYDGLPRCTSRRKIQNLATVRRASLVPERYLQLHVCRCTTGSILVKIYDKHKKYMYLDCAVINFENLPIEVLASSCSLLQEPPFPAFFFSFFCLSGRRLPHLLWLLAKMSS